MQLYSPPGRSAIWLMALVASAGAAHAENRFSGAAGLSKSSEQVSADQRFLLRAELSADSARASGDGRFALSAGLELPASRRKALLTTCGPVADPIFRNGFE